MAEAPSKQQIEQRVIDALVEFGEEPEKVTAQARFEDLEVDSLDLVELAQIAEDEYGVEISDADLEGLETVGDVIGLIAARAG